MKFGTGGLCRRLTKVRHRCVFSTYGICSRNRTHVFPRKYRTEATAGSRDVLLLMSGAWNTYVMPDLLLEAMVNVFEGGSYSSPMPTQMRWRFPPSLRF